MRIRFVNPPIYDLVGSHYRLNQAVGGPLLSAILRRAGHDASYVDAEALHWTMADYREWLELAKPDAIGITVTNLNWEGMKRLVRETKVTSPDTWIALGGPEVTARSSDALQVGADCVAPGECDASVVKIFETRPGFYPANGIVKDLDALPLPAWEHSQPLPAFYDGNMPRFEWPEGCTLWNRGCAHKCTFCSNPVFNRVLIRQRSPDSIVEELRLLKSLGVRHVFVYSDELIGMSPRQTEWLEGVCLAIIKANLGLTFKTQGRCSEAVTPEILKLMAAAGFKAIMWGIESMDQGVLDAVEKGTTPKLIWQTLIRSHNAGIMNWGFFMVGCPGETKQAFAQTVEEVSQLRMAGVLDWKQVTVCTPNPGTVLWEQAGEAGWLSVNPVEVQRFHSTAVLEYPYASKAEIQRRLTILQAL